MRYAIYFNYHPMYDGKYLITIEATSADEAVKEAMGMLVAEPVDDDEED